jgi:hypothetical protein
VKLSGKRKFKYPLKTEGEREMEMVLWLENIHRSIVHRVGVCEAIACGPYRF